MSPFRMSVVAWVTGAVAGAVVAKKTGKSVAAGTLLGAVVVGGLSDKAIELNHPAYAPLQR